MLDEDQLPPTNHQADNSGRTRGWGSSHASIRVGRECLAVERRICLIATLQMIFTWEEQSDGELSLLGQTMQDWRRGFATHVSTILKTQYYEHFMNLVLLKRCTGESCWVSYAITESVLCSYSGHPTACKPDISPGLTCNHISHIVPAPVLPLQAYL